MAAFDFDLFVIGAGSGGVRAARMSASFGARVAIAEQSRVGGTCVIRGCVPKKLLVYASHFREDFEDAAGFGWEVGGASFSWPRLIAQKDREIDRLNGVYIRLLEQSGVEIFPSRAVLRDAHTLQVGDRIVTARIILIATGGHPYLPELAGIEHAITSDEAFHLPSLPGRIVIAGGGYIAVEFAGIFHGLGADTTLLFRGNELLRGFDGDVRRHLGTELAAKGICLKSQSHMTCIDRRADGSLRIALAGGGTLDCDLVMVATGRVPSTSQLCLDAAGVAVNARGAVIVDEYSQSRVENIYAVGDVTDRLALTPVAIKEGAAFAETVFGGRPTRADHRDVPTAVFSQPCVGAVGLTEEQARAELDEVHVYQSVFRPLKHTLSGRNEKTLMKLIVDARSQKVIGAHMVGPDAAEIIQGIAIAVKLGVTKAQFDATVGIHPTAAEEFVTMREKRADPA